MEHITVEYYVAEDGKQFEDEQECIKYEASLHHVKMWKRKNDDSVLGFTLGERTNDLEAAYFIKVGVDDKEYLSDLSDWTGVSIDGIEFTGGLPVFMWDDRAERWRRLLDIIEYYENMADAYNDLMENIYDDEEGDKNE